MSAAAPVIAAVGLTASAYAAGITLAYPLIISKLFATRHQGQDVHPPASTELPSLSIAQRLTVWDRAYHGGMLAVPGSVLSTMASWTTLFVLNNKFESLRHPRARPDWHWLLPAALTQAAVLPFTAIFILPTNNRLIYLRRRANEGEDVDEVEVERLFGQWQRLHFVRVVASSVGFFGSVLSFLL